MIWKDKRMEELKICYVNQFGYDFVIEKIQGLELGTVLRLLEIRKEDSQSQQETKKEVKQ